MDSIQDYYIRSAASPKKRPAEKLPTEKVIEIAIWRDHIDKELQNLVLGHQPAKLELIR